MRFSCFLLPLALLLSFQLVSADAETSIIGTWTNPLNTTDVSPGCCIPTSIKIRGNGTTRYLATFRFPALLEQGYNSKCAAVFISFLGEGNMTLYKNTLSGAANNSYLGGAFFDQVVYDFHVQKGPSLNVFIDSPDPANGCNFTMQSFEGSPSNYSGVTYVIFFAIICAAYIFYRNYQKKQSAALVKQNIVRPAVDYNQIPAYNPPPPTYNPPPKNHYVPPTNVQVEPSVRPGQEFLQDYPKFI